jgi:hypothetical protein
MVPLRRSWYPLSRFIEQIDKRSNCIEWRPSAGSRLGQIVPGLSGRNPRLVVSRVVAATQAGRAYPVVMTRSGVCSPWSATMHGSGPKRSICSTKKNPANDLSSAAPGFESLREQALICALANRRIWSGSVMVSWTGTCFRVATTSPDPVFDTRECSSVLHGDRAPSEPANAARCCMDIAIPLNSRMQPGTAWTSRSR